ncbi:hypothetical protein LTR66_004834 [Elasticomyces elasticus]|nr:hypothetical protein LTR50_000851 [Elasticomyces elasticus]KAK4995316.1 hypothetical protein LTR66_004834 [Elasticomyces elasticus]
MFYNDLIISRSAKENKILLWKIDGFNSADPPPAEPPTANAANAKTRSAFGGRFQRLYEFDAPHSTLYYMRFGLYHAADQHPVLAMGNERSAVYFWDLQKIEEGYEVAAEANGARVKGKKKKKKMGPGTAGMLGEAMGLGKGREGSCGSNASSGQSDAGFRSTGLERSTRLTGSSSLTMQHTSHGIEPLEQQPASRRAQIRPRRPLLRHPASPHHHGAEGATQLPRATNRLEPARRLMCFCRRLWNDLSLQTVGVNLHRFWRVFARFLPPITIAPLL